MSSVIEGLDGLHLAYMILADRAEVVNGKLYIMGGGWDRISHANFDEPVLLSFALGIVVPWTATNEEHRFSLTLVDVDENPIEFRADGGFTAGRPPHMERGDSQILNMALPMLPVRLPKAGLYKLIASINDTLAGKILFRAVSGQPAIPVRS